MTLKSFVKELTHLPRNGFMDFGWGNGYVVIPEGHPMHGKHYDDIPVEVHPGPVVKVKVVKAADFFVFSFLLQLHFPEDLGFLGFPLG